MSLLDAPEGVGLMPLRVIGVREEAEGIRSFELGDATGADLPPFEAGSHIRVEVTLPGGATALRHYSLLGDPRDRSRYRIAVLREADGRGGSRFLHEGVGPGSLLRVTRPEQGFPLREAAHTVLIAGGIGITPILAMAREVEHRAASYELHYAARSPERMALRDEVLATAGDRAHLYFDEGSLTGPLDVEALLATPRPRARVYVCGPPGMIRAVRLSGEAAGWPAGHIHSESFGSARRPEDQPVVVHLERSGLTLHVPAGKTILDAILDAGVWASHECWRGECGACVARVVSGVADHRDVCLPEHVREKYMCPCVSRAMSGSLTLDL